MLIAISNQKTYQWTFVLYYIEIDRVYFAFWVELLPMYDYVTSCIGHMENIGLVR